MWMASFWAIIQIIWKKKNLRCSEGRSSSLEAVTDSTKFVVAYWVSTLPHILDFSLDIILLTWRWLSLNFVGFLFSANVGVLVCKLLSILLILFKLINKFVTIKKKRKFSLIIEFHHVHLFYGISYSYASDLKCVIYCIFVMDQFCFDLQRDFSQFRISSDEII